MKKNLLILFSLLLSYSSFSQCSNITVTFSTSNASCGGGSDGFAAVQVVGPASSYTFNWETGITSDSLLNVTAGVYTITITGSDSCSVIDYAAISETGAPVISITSANNPICENTFDGSISTSIQGGTAPYTFWWTHGATTQNITALSPQSYELEVTDNAGCKAYAEQTISDPAPIDYSYSIIDVSCNGGNDGQINGNATGGVSPYFYAWGGGDTTASLIGISAGTYALTITDNNGCTFSMSDGPLEPGAMVITLSKTDPTCDSNADGSVSTSISGGTGPYTYNWSNGSNTASIAGLVGATYTINVVDANGCSGTNNILLSQTSLPVVTSTVTDASGPGATDGSITLVASGGTAPYTYGWSNDSSNVAASATNLGAGAYSATVTENNGCYAVHNVTVSEAGASILEASASATNETSAGACDGTASGTATGGSGSYTYQWMNLADSSVVGTTASVANLCAGTYLFVADDGAGTASFEVTVGTDSVATQSLVVSTTKSNTSCGGVCDGSATLTATGGAAPYTFNWSNGATVATNSNLCDGTYGYTVTDAAGNTGLGYVNILDGTALSVAIDSVGITSATCGSADGAAGVVPVGGTAPFAYAWNGGQNTSSISGVAAGMHTVVVTDASGCSATFSLVIPDSSGPSVTVASSTNANCGGADGNIMISVSGGTAPYAYEWDNGVTVQNLLDATSGVHYVEVTDASGCVGSASAYIGTSGTNAPTIFGNVTSQAGGNIVSGNVAIYVDAPYTTQMDTAAIAPIDNQGNFYFSSILPIGDYILQVLPDVAQHPNAVPTYNGLTNRWDSATVVTVGCDQNFNFTITTFDLEPLAGNSTFDGTIVSDGTGGRRAGDPIPGVDVSLEQVPGGIIAFKETGSDGKFVFNNVPTGSGQVYKIHVDIPGLTNVATYTINPNATDTVQSGLDFVVSEGQINTVAATVVAEIQTANNIVMYPNPSNGDIFFNITLQDSKDVSYVVYNIVGEQITGKNMGTYHNGVNTFKISGLSAGAYTVAVKQGTKLSTFKVLVIE